MTVYKPRRMPVRYLSGAPHYVLDIFDNGPDWPNDRYDVYYMPEQREMFDAYVMGLSMTANGAWHTVEFSPCELRAWRDSKRSRRIAWHDLPERVRNTVIWFWES